ncbi:MAG: sigma-70 family RNA polymerase sigma factor [Oscillospiraceae bacterium]|nr:sigma-70 family RNA polymerase sigma factor [Oscillospiraceae bacterium]
MEDKAIVDLYWQRSDRAIPETECKYGGYCHTVAMRIVNNRQDAEECVNDTWLGAWNSMPENRPSYLAPYLAKLTRWLSLTKVKTQNRLKRGGNEVTLSLEELDSELGEGTDLAQQIELKELSEYLDAFLTSLPAEERKVFLARYWYAASIREIAEKSICSESKVKSMLLRTRQKLKKALEAEGLC